MSKKYNSLKYISLLIFLYKMISTVHFVSATEKPIDNGIQDFIDNVTMPPYRVFTDKEGLPQNTVNAVEIDSQGYILLGSQNGLAQYDGVNFENIDFYSGSRKSISDFITYIHSSKDNSLWIVNYDGDILRRKDNIWSEVIIPNKLSKNEKIIHITEEQKEDQTWKYFIVTEKNVFVFEDNKWSNIYKIDGIEKGESIKHVESYKYLNKTNLFLLSTNNTIYFNQNNGFEKLPLFESENILLHSIYIGKASFDYLDLTVSTNYGVFNYNITKKTWSKILYGKDISNINADLIWKTYGKNSNTTLYLVDNKQKTLLKYDYKTHHSYNIEKIFSTSNISSVFVRNNNDITEDVWLGTLLSGLFQIRNNLWNELIVNDKFNNFAPSSFVETVDNLGQQVLWVSTFGQGLIKLYSNKIKVFNVNNGFCSNFISKIIESYDETKNESVIWVAANDCLAKIVNDKAEYYYIKNIDENQNSWFISLLESKNQAGGKKLWIGTTKKLLSIKNNDLKTIKEEENIRVHQIIETSDNKNTVWLATNDGFLKYENNKITKTYTELNGLAQDHIYSLFIYENPNGKKELWLGTQNAGLAITDLDSLNNDKPSWKIINQSNFPALPDNTIYSIIQDDNHRIYVFTNRGVIRLDSSPYSTDFKKINFYVFNKDDGLPNSEFNMNAAYYSKHGHIWAGTVNGAVFYNINNETQTNNRAHFFLKQDIVKNGKNIPMTNNILSYTDNNLKFNYRLINYFKGNEVLYSHQLQGIDSNSSAWSIDSKKEFTTLPSGSYIFNVWAKDHKNKIWGPLKSSFIIKPAPWKTNTAIAMYIVFSLASIFGFMKFIISANQKKQHLKQKELEEKIEERTKELSDTISELDNKNMALIQKNREIELAYEELSESRIIAEKIFSALAEALPGTVLDNKYQLEHIIGTGGFSVVYRAKHLTLNKNVAIKIFRPQPNNTNTDSLDKFLKEGTSICKINHPNAVVVLDTGISDSTVAYIVMELLEGCTLAKKMGEKAIFSIKETLEIIEPICNLLDCAHKIGIIHRDIKPENIFLHNQANSSTVVVKILDFGIAKEILDDNFNSHLTQTQNIAGTPYYMAPERLLGLTSDDKVDVYATAIVMYELLAGTTPFSKKADSMGELLLQHLNEKITPLYTRNRYIPKELSDCIGYALAKEPLSRPSIKRFWKMVSEFSNIDYDISLIKPEKIIKHDELRTTSSNEELMNETISLGENTIHNIMNLNNAFDGKYEHTE